MTTIAEWNSVPGVKDISPLFGAYSINGTDPKAVEQLFVSMMRDAVSAENSLNTTRADSTNYFGNTINERGEFRGTVNVPVTLGSVSVA
ncbi:MAG: hypothetical protein J7525_19680 [Roseofilum sp. SID3]|uniref:hypothetical protein n=1 Tax=Roseofilum sp. SID3 TaxID=2821499 RepID=UPI001AFCEDB1|nr:hypothetical protein [Roseofilum sp. SID3]MBP0015317.1 hypothetical protein [Roseofilum sp. SID3]